MDQAQVYKGTFEEVSRLHGEELAQRNVIVTVEEGAASVAEARPFYETATIEEWIAEWMRMSGSHIRNKTALSEEAADRDSIYEGRG